MRVHTLRAVSRLAGAEAGVAIYTARENLRLWGFECTRRPIRGRAFRYIEARPCSRKLPLTPASRPATPSSFTRRTRRIQLSMVLFEFCADAYRRVYLLFCISFISSICRHNYKAIVVCNIISLMVLYIYLKFTECFYQQVWY